MFALTVGLLAAAAALQPSAMATAETEMLGVDVPDEFEAGYQAGNDAMKIIELVQPPETVENWSKLITLQIFLDGAKKATAAKFYGQWRDALRRSCPGLKETSIEGSVDGKPAIRGDLACPNNPETNKPENVSGVIVQGDANLLMIQVAFRRSIASADAALIKRVTGSLKVCDERTFESCKARTATGFVPVK